MTLNDFLIGCASDCIEGDPEPLGGLNVATAGKAGLRDQATECQHVWVALHYWPSAFERKPFDCCTVCGAVRHG